VSVLTGRCHEWLATDHTNATATGLEDSWQIRAAPMAINDAKNVVTVHHTCLI